MSVTLSRARRKLGVAMPDGSLFLRIPSKAIVWLALVLFCFLFQTPQTKVAFFDANVLFSLLPLLTPP